MLVSRSFCSASSTIPPDVAPDTAYRISDLELASRLSFFLWSSIPDDELLDAAERGELQQARRAREASAADAGRSARRESLVSNFAEQWLYLRNLESITPDLRLFPDFDDNLRQALRRETELLFESILREDRSVLDLLKADYTFLNERLAKHYGIPHVYGSRFRRVALDTDSAARRPAAPGQHPDRDVVRHAHVAGDSRQMGSGEPRRHAAAAAAAERAGAEGQHRLGDSFRARAAGRASRQCRLRELPQPDGPGRLRAGELRRGRPLARRSRRASRSTPPAACPTAASSPASPGWSRALLKRPELFVGTLTEKLLTFALGRGVEPYDAPAVRKIVRDAQADDLSFLVDHRGNRQQHAVSR